MKSYRQIRQQRSFIIWLAWQPPHLQFRRVLQSPPDEFRRLACIERRPCGSGKASEHILIKIWKSSPFPLKGKLKHGDNHQNSRIIIPGDIQNHERRRHLPQRNERKWHWSGRILQIWVMPEKLNTPPAYQDFDVRPLLRKNEMALIVSPDGDAPARLLQQTWFSIGEIEAGKKIDYHMHQSHSGVYIFVMEGEVKVDGTILTPWRNGSIRNRQFWAGNIERLTFSS